MDKISKIIYFTSALLCSMGIALNWYIGESITWPAIALFWCINSFMNEFKK